jgi:hypothetical protein
VVKVDVEKVKCQTFGYGGSTSCHWTRPAHHLKYVNANIAKSACLCAFLFTPQPAGGSFSSILSGTGGEAASN